MQRIVRLLVAGAAALSLSGAAAPAASVETSSNWAGYAVLGRAAPLSFESVTGTWRQPRARCPRGSAGAVSIWVGLGGNDPRSDALHQVGTEVECTRSGDALYSVWYELIPAPSAPVPLDLRAGDLVTASVDVDLAGRWVRVRIANRTTGHVFARRIRVSRADTTSAEWVVEAPSACDGASCRVVPLARFGRVRFTQALAVAGGRRGGIRDAAWARSAIRLVPGSRGRHLPGGPTPNAGSAAPAAGARPTAVGADGASFSVVWEPLGHG